MEEDIYEISEVEILGGFESEEPWLLHPVAVESTQLTRLTFPADFSGEWRGESQLEVGLDS